MGSCKYWLYFVQYFRYQGNSTYFLYFKHKHILTGSLLTTAKYTTNARNILQRQRNVNNQIPKTFAIETLKMSSLNLPKLLEKKRDGLELRKDEIEDFIEAVVSTAIDECQIGAMLMAMYLRGLTSAETVALTVAMATRGSVMDWGDTDWADRVVDKHSTGGVGDKTSLMLTPALAACGLKVPMISARGLAHTGGTIDKLESIAGFNSNLSDNDIRSGLDNIGCVICGQTGTIAPADGVLYKTRDITGTVPSIPLITASILSKKAAEGLVSLVMDVKHGVGAFMPSVEAATELADSLVRTAKAMGIRTSAVVSNMDAPIGFGIGNSLEVLESVQVLKGGGSKDLRDLVAALGGQLIYSVKRCSSREDGEKRIKDVLDNGKALEKFKEILVFQGVTMETANHVCGDEGAYYLPASGYRTEIVCPSSGWVSWLDSKRLALVCFELGAGRRVAGAPLQYGVGVWLDVGVGSEVARGQRWVTVHHDTAVLDKGLEEEIKESLVISDVPIDAPDRVTKIIE